MSLIELFLLAVGLSMDAFAVAVCKGLSTQRLCPRHYLIVGAWFGGFQALMPTLGWLLGSTFAEHITRFDHWIAFVLLALIGGNMIREGVAGDGEKGDDSFSFRTMLLLAVATSIDALAIGVTFALAPPTVGIGWAVGLIGAVTFLLSGVGLKIGNVFGLKYRSRAVVVGGAILILIGLKILLEHLGVLPF
ncbi:MAG: manganese efflux pump MntP family protein [Eubacteriales bacterium]|mgnify:FL=1|nr:manganese efflux pump MntP family protein [Oscillospiraceae bacterium]MDY3925655.1 manganese efflux pump MntP family protein [Eubacteriales bacterium]UKI13228.1 MAG: manganese efflux pump MntP family protein [Oscillospiraceae bacterium]